LLLEVEAGEVVGVFTGFAARGRSAEQVATDALTAADAWVDADVPVDEHLADQLLLPLALAGSGSFRTVAPSGHTSTNATIIEQFLPVRIRITPGNRGDWVVEVGR
jgi:RNA 3'-terminal phosphate cyclase (ATP)